MDAPEAGFRWDIPARYNIGVDVCDRWGTAEPERPAILEVAADAQRDVDRHAEMCRQYAIQGYADIEYTDPEDYDEDRMDWRPWAYLKEVGLAD